MDDHGHLQGSFAMNAGLAIVSMLYFFLDKKDTHICNIGELMYDTIDFKVQDSNPKFSQKELNKHPLILEEIDKQLEMTTNTRINKN